MLAEDQKMRKEKQAAEEEAKQTALGKTLIGAGKLDAKLSFGESKRTADFKENTTTGQSLFSFSAPQQPLQDPPIKDVSSDEVEMEDEQESEKKAAVVPTSLPVRIDNRANLVMRLCNARDQIKKELALFSNLQPDEMSEAFLKSEMAYTKLLKLANQLLLNGMTES